MAKDETSDLLPSIAQILRRAGALDRQPGVDLQAVSRLPVFQTRSWKRAIGEFLRWSGTTPDAWGATSMFELLLCHGAAGARAIFEAYRHDRLERAATFEDASAQLEAVRTVVSMAAYWLHVIAWDLRDAHRLSAEEFQARRRRSTDVPVAATARLADSLNRLLSDDEPRPAGRSSTGVPVYPAEAGHPNMWKSPPDKKEPAPPDSSRWRPRAPRG